MQETFIILGLVCLIAAIVGGGLKAFGIEIPLLNSLRRRVLLGLLGIILIVIGSWVKTNHSRIEVEAAEVKGIGRVAPDLCTQASPCEGLARGSALQVRLTRRGYATAYLQDRWGKFYNQEGRLLVSNLTTGDIGLWPGTDREISHTDFKLWVVTSEEPIPISVASAALSTLPPVKNGYVWGPVYLLNSSHSPPECRAATITGPVGARDRNRAQQFTVSREFAVTWNPPDCSMIIQYYQNNQLMSEIKPAVLSGTSLRVQNSGETQIKICYESESGRVIADERWIWVNGNTINEFREPAGRIISPIEDQLVDSSFAVKGALEYIPANHHAWLTIQNDTRCWPKDPEILASDSNIPWFRNLSEGGPSGKMFAVALIVVNEEGHRFIQDWLAQGRETRDYPGIKQIPGAITLSTVRVTLGTVDDGKILEQKEGYRKWKPPNKTGIVYVVIGKNKEQPIDVYAKFGEWDKKEKVNLNNYDGLILKLDHSNSDSYPLIIKTNGNIIKGPSQDGLEGEWNDRKYLRLGW